MWWQTKMLCISLQRGRRRREYITVNPSSFFAKKKSCLRFIVLGQCVMLFINSLPRGRNSVFTSAFPADPSKCTTGIVPSS